MVQVHLGPPRRVATSTVPQRLTHVERWPMKKLAVGLLAAVAGLLAYQRLQSSRAEQDLWAEATDPVN